MINAEGPAGRSSGQSYITAAGRRGIVSEASNIENKTIPAA